MPFINSKITKKITREDEAVVKEKLGRAILRLRVIFTLRAVMIRI